MSEIQKLRDPSEKGEFTRGQLLALSYIRLLLKRQLRNPITDDDSSAYASASSNLMVHIELKINELLGRPEMTEKSQWENLEQSICADFNADRGISRDF